MLKRCLFNMREGKYPKSFLNICLLIFSLGILFGDRDIGMLPLGILLIVFLALSFILTLKQSRFTFIVVALLFFIFGNFRSNIFLNPGDLDISNYWGKEAVVCGTLEGDPRVREDENGEIHLRYVVKADTVKSDKEEKRATGKIIVYSKFSKSNDKDNKDTDKYGRSGDYIKVIGKIRQPHDYQNPGRMNNIMIQRSQEITAQMSAHKADIEERDGDFLLRMAGNIRNFYRELMEKAMSKEDAAAIFAMLFGGYQGIKEELLESFTTTGIVHILSVSGSHITLLAGTAGLIGKLLRLPDRVTIILATVVIIIYGILAGAVPPVIRSAIMGILTLMAMTMGREKDARHILSLVALCMLINSPLLIYDISFQLSFGATAGLVYIAPVIREYLRKIKIRDKKISEFFAGSIAVTIGAQLSVLPLIAWYFNVISFSSLLANLIVVPIVEWIIVIGLFAGLIGGIFPFVGKAVFIIASLMLGLVYEMTKLIAKLPGSKCYLPTMGMVSCIIYYIILWISIQKKEKLDIWWCYVKENIWKFSGGVAFITVFALCFYMTKEKQMEMHCIDVGQGLAWLCKTPNGHAFMIDTGGTRDKGYDVGARVDVPYLLHYGITELDYIFLTHAHSDHAGGVKGVIEKIKTNAVMIGHEGIDEYKKVMGNSETVRKEKMLALKENTEMEIDGVKVEILYSPTKENAVSAGNATGNEFSNLFRISYGKASFLITGDLVKEQEAVILEKGTDVGATVLSVGHHGSHTSSSEEFLRSVNPKWSVISCGFENSFGHPHKDILERLENCTNSEIMRTDLQGAIIFRTDGRKMSVEKYIG